MKPSELYARVPEEISYDLYGLLDGYSNHIPEVADIVSFDHEENERTKRVQVCYYKNFMFDCRRFWSLGGVFFDGKPVMIIQNAGREGTDFHGRFVTDREQYFEMVKYILTLIDPEKQGDPDVYPVDEDIEGLDEFYGNKLDGYFARFDY